uniref:Uncharacterized protein n=1 Tax=Arundo donax TaxID=35708 RepID=A0A0A9BQK1_ARUDO
MFHKGKYERLETQRVSSAGWDLLNLSMRNSMEADITEQ